MVVCVVESDALLQVATGSHQFTKPIQRIASNKMGFYQEEGIWLRLREGKYLLSNFPYALVIALQQMKRPQPNQYGEEGCLIVQLLAQRLCPKIGAFYFGSAIASDCHEEGTQRRQQREFLARALRSIGEGFERLQSFLEVRNRFAICRALGRSLPCFIPVSNCLRIETRLCIVLCQ